MAQSFVRPGYRSVTPRIVARDTAGLVSFLRDVFGASGEYRREGPAEITIGDSMLLISDPGVRPPTPAFLYLYVPDVGVVYRRAVEAGARTLEAPTDTPYGDRRCTIEDRWGNVWQIATFTH